MGLLPDRIYGWSNLGSCGVTEERILKLESHVTDLRIQNSELATNVVNLTESVRELTKTVLSLRDAVNQGKGALWLAMTAAGAFGALVVIVFKKIFGAS